MVGTKATFAVGRRTSRSTVIVLKSGRPPVASPIRGPWVLRAVVSRN
jgi:hypothetical protein